MTEKAGELNTKKAEGFAGVLWRTHQQTSLSQQQKSGSQPTWWRRSEWWSANGWQSNNKTINPHEYWCYNCLYAHKIYCIISQRYSSSDCTCTCVLSTAWMCVLLQNITLLSSSSKLINATIRHEDIININNMYCD